MQPINKIVIIGPESTGKSTLCKQLAQHYNTLWVPEYAREYLLQHGTNYSYQDLEVIAKGQTILEDAYEQNLLQMPHKKNNQPLKLIVDTDMYVMKVWCEFVFNKCHQYIIDQIAERRYSLYLLCNTDLPWVKDELREYPHLETRKQLFNIYKNMLQQQNTPWQIISGSNDERLANAVKFIDNAKP